MTSTLFPVLDLTRSLTRIGRGPPTGIDRVERAWLRGLLARDGPLAGLVRTSAGYCWLDRAGCAAFLDRLEGRVPLGQPDALSRLSLKLPPWQRAAESDLRRLATGRALRGGLPGLLTAQMPRGAIYLNLGHSHLDEPALAAIARRGRVVVMIHDVIPLALPDTQRPGMAERFAERLRAVGAHASLVLAPSRAAAGTVAARLGGAVPVLAAPLGVTLVEPRPAELPAALATEGPYMLSVGTLDPRKNQALLVDIWRCGGAGLPALHLAGALGWGPPDLHRALAAPPPGVRVLHGLSDGAVAALMEGAAALLHPSRAEGYGLPPLEAALRGTPVIVSDLPVHRETLGDTAVYVAADDRYQWESAIKARAEKGPPSRAERDRAKARLDRPTWETHLNLVLTRLCD